MQPYPLAKTFWAKIKDAKSAFHPLIPLRQVFVNFVISVFRV